MKILTILLALVSTMIFFTGCSKKATDESPVPAGVVTFDKLQNRNDIFYEADQSIPFTGVTQDFYPDGQKHRVDNFKDGKPQGITTMWYENGQKKAKGNLKDGKSHGVATMWRENGTKIGEGNFKDGKMQGVLTRWYENDQKKE